MNPKIALSFLTTDTDADLVVDSGRILASMIGNANYPAPVPAVADLQLAHDAYVIAVNALDGGTHSTALRDRSRADLVSNLRSLAYYVQQACRGDRVTLLSSGFSTQKDRQPVGQLPAPQNVRLRHLKVSGQIKAYCDVVTNACMYQWRTASALTPNTWTISEPTRSANFTLTNLTPGSSYVVQARAFGTAGPTDWSDAATLMSL